MSATRKLYFAAALILALLVLSGILAIGQDAGYGASDGSLLQGLSEFYALVSIACGIILCFFGYRWFRFVLFLMGFFAGFTAGFLGGAMSPVGILLGLVLGILLGFIFRFVYYLGLFVLGAFFGLILGVFVAPPAALLFALLGGIAAVVFHKVAVIFSTSFVGSFLIVTSAFGLATGKNLFMMAFESYVFPTFALDPDQLMLVVGLTIGLGLVGVLVQAATTTHLPSRLQTRTCTRAPRPGEFIRANPEGSTMSRQKPQGSEDREDPGQPSRLRTQGPSIAESSELERQDDPGYYVTSTAISELHHEHRVGGPNDSQPSGQAEFERAQEDSRHDAVAVSRPSPAVIDSNSTFQENQRTQTVEHRVDKHCLELPALFPSRREIVEAIKTWESQTGSSSEMSLLVIRNEHGNVCARALAVGLSCGHEANAVQDASYQEALGVKPALAPREHIQGEHGVVLVEY
ncbi:TMEM198/TM7SF3 family protein [Candidatus Bipolaricaulota bacterium]